LGGLGNGGPQFHEFFSAEYQADFVHLVQLQFDQIVIDFYLNQAALDPLEYTGILAARGLRAHLDFGSIAGKAFEVLGSLDRAIDSGAGDLESVLSFDGIVYVQLRRAGSTDPCTVPDLHSAGFVYEDPEYKLTSLESKLQTDQVAAFHLHSRLKQHANALKQCFLGFEFHDASWRLVRDKKKRRGRTGRSSHVMQGLTRGS
jgi:hypothetical protein